MRVWKRGGKFGGESGKENGGTFRYGTRTVKSSRALRSSLAQTGTHNTQLSAALPGSYQYREHEKNQQTTSFSVQSLNNQQFLTAPWTGSRFNSQLCHRPIGWVLTNHNTQLLVYVAARTQYWYFFFFFWSCAKDMKVKQFNQLRISF